MQPNTARTENETPVLSDRNSPVWTITSAILKNLGIPHVRIDPEVDTSRWFGRFQTAPHLFYHWESARQSRGVLIEDLVEHTPLYDVADRLIILTSTPTREDVIAFHELGIQRVVRINRTKTGKEKARREIEIHCRSLGDKTKLRWLRLQRLLNNLTPDSPAEQREQATLMLEKLNAESGYRYKAMHTEAKATLHLINGQEERAEELWKRSIEMNPNFYRAYNNLARYYESVGRTAEALAIHQKLQNLNRDNIGRMVSIATLHHSRQDLHKAEHYYQLALEKNPLCAAARNGMARLAFDAGDYEGAKNWLARSGKTDDIASNLNEKGIRLVRQERYKEALEHYSNALYVLPMQNKGPMLFFNIGLGYHRWGNSQRAAEFLRLALIKQPDYAKARQLLEKIQQE